MGQPNEANVQRPTLEQLKGFFPFDQLPDGELELIRGKANLHLVNNNSVIFNRDERDDWVFYLLDGQVRLQGGGTESTLVKCNSPQSRQALAPGKPRTMTARAISRCTILRVHHDVLNVCFTPDPGQSYEVQELHAEDDSPINRLQFQVYTEYLEDRMQIPGLPEISVRIQHAVDDPTSTAEQIARMLQAEPSLAGRMVSVANSAMYPGRPVSNLQDTVVRLGMKTTRDLVTNFVTREMFKPKHAALKKRLLDLWRYSTLVAAVSFVTSRVVKNSVPDQALLAGLFHGIGRATLLTRLEDHPELAESERCTERVLTELSGEVGAMVLRKWSLPEQFVTVARESDWWDREGTDSADLCDIVLLARVFVELDQHHKDMEEQFLNLPAYERLGIAGQFDDIRHAVQRDAKQEINELRQLLL